MKRFTIILFTAFYASLSLGFDLNLHYCGGQLSGVSVAIQAPTCCCDGEQGLSDCCKDAQLSIQMDVDQVNMANPGFEDISYHCAACAKTMEYVGIDAVVEKVIPNVQPNPPPTDGQFRRIAMGSLTFYG